MTRVFFLITSAARERMWATVRNQPDGIETLLPEGVRQTGSATLYKSNKSWKGRLKQLASILLPLPNVTFRTDIPAEADVVYTWSKFPLRTRKPFVIELDNPYALAYYSRRGLLILRPLIRMLLKRAKHIAFMSEACGATFRSLFPNLSVPQSVSYPFMPSRSHERVASSDGTVRFMIVALNFRLKGGPELVEAWRRAKLPQATLRIITADAVELREKYEDIPGLFFEEPRPNEELLSNVFPNADIFVYPTFFDSFGVVLLEALSFGLGIITTDVYATPELVEEGVSGRILAHPILEPKEVGGRMIVSPIEEHFSTFTAKHLGPHAFYEDLCTELVEALTEGAGKYREWQEGSEALFAKRFSPDAWQENMRKMLER